MNDITSKKIKSGSFLVIFSNLVLILTNVVKTLIIPMIIVDLKMYSYWQIYLFYLSYVLIVSLGYNDGFYVKCTGKDTLKDDKDFSIRNSLLFQLLITAIISVILIILILALGNGEKKIIYILIVLNFIPMEFIDISLKIFQANFEMKSFSVFNVLDKFLFLLMIIFIIPFKKVNWIALIIIDIISKILISMAMLFKLKEYWIINKIDLKKGIKKWVENVRIGRYILTSSYLLILISGIGRIAIEWIGNVEDYAFYSLAMSFSNVVNLIIGSMGLILFPIYINMGYERSLEYSNKISKLLLILTSIVLISYYPISLFITIFIPRYINSISYLLFILPLTVFKGFSSLIFIPLMKSGRKEKQLLYNNGIALLIYLLVIIPMYFLTKSIYCILVGTICITFIELMLNAISLNYDKKNLIYCLIINIIYLFLGYYFKWYVNIVALILILIVLIVFNYDEYCNLVNIFLKDLKKEEKNECI